MGVGEALCTRGGSNGESQHREGRWKITELPQSAPCSSVGRVTVSNAALRGDGRRVKTPRSSPRMAGEAPLSGRLDGRAEAAAAAEPRRKGHKRGGEADAAHHGRQLRQRANET